MANSFTCDRIGLARRLHVPARAGWWTGEDAPSRPIRLTIVDGRGRIVHTTVPVRRLGLTLGVARLGLVVLTTILVVKTTSLGDGF